MDTISLRDAKARLSALVEAAQNGKETIVTKNGRPAAKIVPIEANETSTERKPTFVELLMSMPHDIPIRRNRSRPRKVDL